jgi:hypothetical protein
MSEQTITLGEKDCAMIFKQDMSSELIIPKFADEEPITWEENQNMFLAIAISAAMSDADFRAVISKKIGEIMEKSHPETAACDPGDGSDKDCSAGCCGCGPKKEIEEDLDEA